MSEEEKSCPIEIVLAASTLIALEKQREKQIVGAQEEQDI